MTDIPQRSPESSIAAALEVRKFSLINRAIGITRRSPTAAIGLLIIAIFAFMAVATNILVPHDPVGIYTDRILQGPSGTHWFGTDGNGMDVFSRVVFGARFAFGIAIPAVVIALVIGVPMGLWTGYRGGCSTKF